MPVLTGRLSRKISLNNLGCIVNVKAISARWRLAGIVAANLQAELRHHPQSLSSFPLIALPNSSQVTHRCSGPKEKMFLFFPFAAVDAVRKLITRLVLTFFVLAVGPQSLRGLPNGFPSQQQIPQNRSVSSRLPPSGKMGMEAPSATGVTGLGKTHADVDLRV